jgi:type II secretory pathway pseudopilin PulG
MIMARNRRGVSLVGLLIVMGIAGVILTTAAGLIRRAMTAQKDAWRDDDLQRVAQRLTTQLREDIHQARQVTLEPMGATAQQLRLQLVPAGDETVTYDVDAHTVRRTHATGGGPRRFEQFALPASCQVVFVEEPGETHRVIVTVYRDRGIETHMRTDTPESETAETPDVLPETGSRRIVLHVVAVVGRDHRFDSSPNPSSPSEIPAGVVSSDAALAASRPIETRSASEGR